SNCVPVKDESQLLGRKDPGALVVRVRVVEVARHPGDNLPPDRVLRQKPRAILVAPPRRPHVNRRILLAQLLVSEVVVLDVEIRNYALRLDGDSHPFCFLSLHSLKSWAFLDLLHSSQAGTRLPIA